MNAFSIFVDLIYNLINIVKFEAGSNRVLAIKDRKRMRLKEMLIDQVMKIDVDGFTDPRERPLTISATDNTAVGS